MNKLNIIYSINCNVADLVMQTFIKIEITISYVLTKKIEYIYIYLRLREII